VDPLGVTRRHAEHDQRHDLGASETADHLTGLRVEHHRREVPVRRDRQHPASEVAHQQAVAQRRSGLDDGRAVQPHLCLLGAEQFTWRLADEMVQGTIELAARGIREAAHRELHVLAKPPMQVSGDRNSRWGQRDLVRRRLALPLAWVGKLQ